MTVSELLSRIHWPALIVGLVLFVYWFRVIQMVRKARKTAGHDANFIPPEPLGRALRILWIPTVALWVFLPIICSFVAFDFAPLRPLPLINNVIAHWIAALVAVVAFIITWVCWINMGKSWRMGINPGEKTELVFTGPFAYVRHPIYGLSQLLMLMTIVILPSPLMLVIGVIHILFLQWEVRREERYLVQLHGDAYRSYQANVGRFFPKSLRAYHRST